MDIMTGHSLFCPDIVTDQYNELFRAMHLTTDHEFMNF